MSAVMQEETKKPRVRGPGKKTVDAFAAEYHRGFVAGAESVDRAPEGLAMAIFYGVVSVLSFALGAWIF